jgi:serine/threonine protein kinase/tetratricopeptide (TPR) repeat protein
VTRPAWEVVQELFLAALDQDSEVRTTWVSQHASDPQVAEEVLSLLSAHARTSPFDALVDAQDARELADEDGVGAHFGPWEVIGELGRGGMGVVYHVRRADGQFEQDGALKVLAADRVDAGTEARFFSERQILAELSHPNIAKLLDGGVSPDGRPHFVMERVEGTPIDLYCDQLRLGIKRRLRLFLSVCAAVQHAHRSLIVHRDLKPSNILVTGEGAPMLLDFGIAKLLMEGLDAPTGGPTLDGSRLFTPGYASPEQMMGRPITTASDVYQLGILLYQLLSGHHPFRDPSTPADGIATDPDADSIVPPSRRFTDPERARAMAAARATSPDRLRRELAGDLDAIVLKALRPEPVRRYGSAGELADDLRRHLDRRPVLARPDTLGYRSGRFLRRHVAATVATTGAFLAVVGFAIGVERQARATAVERDRAQQVIDFLVELFTSADPYRVRGAEVTVREVLDRGAQRARTELSEQPLVQATLMEAIGEVYRSLGVRDVSMDLRAEALDARRRVVNPDDPSLAVPLSRIALLASETGDFSGADTLLPLALALLRRDPAASTAEYVSALNDIGYAWQVRGDLDRAEPLLEESLRRSEEPGSAPRDVAPVLTNLGNIRQARGDLDSAAALFRRSVGARRTQAADDPRLATSLESLAAVLQRLGSLDEAEAAVTEALAIRRRVLPEEHVALAGPLHLGAMILRSRGRSAEAEPFLREALTLRENALGEDHFVVAYAKNALALVLEDLGRLDEAEELFRRSWEVYVERFGADHVNPAFVEANLARLLMRRGEVDEALVRFDHALPIARRTMPNDRVFAGDLITVGLAHCRGTSPARADSVLSEAVEALRPEPDQPPPDDYLRALNARGSCLYRAGRFDEAERVLNASLEASRDRPEDDPYRAFALQVLVDMGRAGR